MRTWNTVLLVTIFSLISLYTTAQKVNEPQANNPEWSKPYPPFRIAGNLYYVGTHDLACYLVTTAAGNILINTGLAASAEQIKNNVEALGFKFSDIKIITTTQVHYDHVAAIAAIKKMTGAMVVVDQADATALGDGGISDYELGKYGVTFEPVKADRILRDNEVVQLGDMQLTMLHHPGHTKGSCSFLLTVKDDQKSYKVLIANMPSIIIDREFSEVTSYPNIAKDYEFTFHAMKNISFDIWVASHASQFKLHEKHKPGDAYNPAAFIDKQGYDKALGDLEKQYDEKLSGKP